MYLFLLLFIVVTGIFIVYPSFRVMGFAQARDCTIRSIHLEQGASSGRRDTEGQPTYRVRLELTFHLPNEDLQVATAYDTGPAAGYDTGSEVEFMAAHKAGTVLPFCYYDSTDPSIAALSKIPNTIAIALLILDLCLIPGGIYGIYYFAAKKTQSK